MQRTLFCLLIICQFISQPHIIAQNWKLKVGKEPSWVTVNKPDYTNTTLVNDARDGYFDLAYEKQVSVSTQSKYFKKVIKILSDAGVQNSSEIAIDFHPAFEQLMFHSIQIIREGKKYNKLHLSQFKTIQQERELDRHLYDASLTALLVLEDVRKGDIIETSYTIKGFNPIFKGKYSDTYDLNYAVPVASLYYKLLVPVGRNIQFKNSQTTVTPITTLLQNETMYEWKLQNAPSLYLESKTPDWFNPYANVSVSEYKDWAEVSNWASALFRRHITIGAALQNKINSIQQENASMHTRVLAALHFVQDDVRYMGIQNGVGSHKPNDPNSIFIQRFGDCKDKSYLLVTMLQALGVEAYPVLINTNKKRAIKDELPTASAFNHCVVKTVLNGKEYWFDPTISYQRGTLDNISFPAYQAGLVVSQSTKNISTIPDQATGLVDVKEIFTVPNKSGLAYLKVITTTTGSFADVSRFEYNNHSVHEMKQKYKDFYAMYFENITADSLHYTSDNFTGAFTTTENYTIHNIWKTRDGSKKIFFAPYVIKGVMTKPADKNRSMPFALSYPAKYKEVLEIHLPENWPIKEYNQTVACGAFKLQADAASVGKDVRLSFEYENLKDCVMPNEAAQFFENYEKANDAEGFEISYQNGDIATYSFLPNTTLSKLSSFPRLYVILAIMIVFTILWRIQRQKQY